MMSFKPAGNGKAEMAQYIHTHYPGYKTVFCHFPNSPYSEGSGKGLVARFYVNHEVMLEDILSMKATEKTEKEKLLYVLPKGFYTERKYLEKSGYVAEKQSIPFWIAHLNILFGIQYDERILILYSKQEDE